MIVVPRSNGLPALSEKTPMSRKLRLILASSGFVFLLLLLAPFLVPVNQFRPSIEEKASTALGRKVTIGNLRLSLFRSSINAEDLSIGDDPKFSPFSFLTAKSLRVGVKLLPLIFSKTLKVTNIALQDPQVALIRNSAGQWNYFSLGSSTDKPLVTKTAELAKRSVSSSSAANLSIENLRLVDGKISFASTDSQNRTTYDHVNISASDVGMATRFSVVVTADLPGGGKLKFDGSVGPVDRTNVSFTPIVAKVEVQSFDLASTKSLSPSVGLGGFLNLNETLTSQNSEVETRGTAKVSKALLIAGGSPASEPVSVDFSTNYDLRKNTGTLNPSTLKIGNASAHLDGTYQTSEETVVNLKLEGQDMPVQDLETFLPALGIILPKGAKLKSGRLNANLNLTGPTSKIVATGDVGLFNAKLAGFDLGSKTPTFSSLTGIPAGKDLEIEKFTTNLRMSFNSLQLNQLVIVVPSFGKLAGGGAIDSRNNLDFKTEASLTAASEADRSPVVIDLSGTYHLRSENPSLNLAMYGQKLPIDELQERMTAAGIKLPNGSTLKGGSLDVALSLTGQAKDLVISGPIQLKNTRLIGFDLGSRIRGIASLSGMKTGDTTSITTLQANLVVTGQGTQLDEIFARIPAIGVITGNGTVSPTSELDFALSVRATGAQGVGKIGAGLLTKLDTSTSSGVPMLVSGTANAPIVTADVHGIYDRRKKAFLDRLGKRN